MTYSYEETNIVNSFLLLSGEARYSFADKIIKLLTEQFKEEKEQSDGKQMGIKISYYREWSEKFRGKLITIFLF